MQAAASMQEGFPGWALHLMIAVQEDGPAGLHMDAAAGLAGGVPDLVAAALAGDRIGKEQVDHAAELAAKTIVLYAAGLPEDSSLQVFAALAEHQLEQLQTDAAAVLAAGAAVLHAVELGKGSIGLAGHAAEPGWDETLASWAHAACLGSAVHGVLAAAAWAEVLWAALLHAFAAEAGAALQGRVMKATLSPLLCAWCHGEAGRPLLH